MEWNLQRIRTFLSNEAIFSDVNSLHILLRYD